MNNSICLKCGKGFYVKPFQKKRGRGKYCSVNCLSESNKTGKYLPCDTCGKKIWRTPKQTTKSKSGKFFCNKSCQTIWRNKHFSGPEHPLWKGGERNVYRKNLIKSGREIKCVRCGEDDKRIMVVHHIDWNRDNNNLDNLTWLCFNCHWLVHKHNELL